MGMLENRVPKRKFGCKKDDVTGDWRKLYNERLQKTVLKRHAVGIYYALWLPLHKSIFLNSAL
jgi:hypothetical protein